MGKLQLGIRILTNKRLLKVLLDIFQYFNFFNANNQRQIFFWIHVVLKLSIRRDKKGTL
jgi:hypothetical protein